jgi:hypothetical protein
MFSWFRRKKTKKSNTFYESDVYDDRVPPDFDGETICGLPTAYLDILAGGTDTPLTYSSFDSGSRSSMSDAARDIKCEVLANWLHAKAEARMWLSGQPEEGVFVKQSKGNYALSPTDLDIDSPDLFAAVTEMNVRVCGVHLFSFLDMLTLTVRDDC